MPLFTRHLLQQPNITADLPCASCGYNLRGLTRAGRCPECGIEIRASLNPDRTVPYAAKTPLSLGFALLGLSLAMSFVTIPVISFYARVTAPYLAYIIFWVLSTHIVWLVGVSFLSLRRIAELLWTYESGHLRIFAILNFISIIVVAVALTGSSPVMEILAVLQAPLLVVWWILQSALIETAAVEICWRLGIKHTFALRLAGRVRYLLFIQLVLCVPPICCLALGALSPLFIAPIALVALTLPIQSLLLFHLALRIGSHRLPAPP